MTDSAPTVQAPALPGAPPAKRGPGRPPGLPKTGGRKPGVPNRTTVETRSYIQQRADPVEFLCRVALGLQVEAAAEPGSREKTLVRPTLEQRVDAAKVLARKILPDMKAVEHTGDSSPFVFQFVGVVAPPGGGPAT